MYTSGHFIYRCEAEKCMNCPPGDISFTLCRENGLRTSAFFWLTSTKTAVYYLTASFDREEIEDNTKLQIANAAAHLRKILKQYLIAIDDESGLEKFKSLIVRLMSPQS
jgi:hypothetical protein